MIVAPRSVAQNASERAEPLLLAFRAAVAASVSRNTPITAGNARPHGSLIGIFRTVLQ